MSTGQSWEVAVVGLGVMAAPLTLAFQTAGCRVLPVPASPATAPAIPAPSDDLPRAAAILIAVPTPLDRHRLPDFTELRRACDDVVANAVSGQTVILTSTTYAGATRDLLVRPLARRGLRAGLDVHVAFSPVASLATVGPSTAEATEPAPPNVVGGATAACTRAAAVVLGRAGMSVHPVRSPEAAEMTSLLQICYRTINAAFINEFADLSHAMGLDIAELITAASTSATPYRPFWPSAGEGGPALSAASEYLLWHLRQQRLSSPMLEHAARTLAQRPLHVVARATQLLAQQGIATRGARVMVLGVTAEADGVDLQLSAAVEVIETLTSLGAVVRFYDPLVPELRLPDGRLVRRSEDPCRTDVDLVIVHRVPEDPIDWLPRSGAILDTTYRIDHHAVDLRPADREASHGRLHGSPG